MHQLKYRDLSEGIKKENICYLQDILFKYKDTYRLKVNALRKIYHISYLQKEAGVAMLIADRTYFKKSHQR